MVRKQTECTFVGNAEMRAQRTSVSPDAIVSVSEAKTHLNLTSDTFDATLQ